jgi:hypothetical protein
VVVTDAMKKKDPSMDVYDIAKLSDQAFWVIQREINSIVPRRNI